MPRRYPPVASKRDFVRRYRQGEFGNRAPTWDTLEECLGSGYRGMLHIRNRVAGGPTWYNVPSDFIRQSWGEVLKTGITESQLYISGMAPHCLGTIQGEVRRSPRHLELRYNRARTPMRYGFELEDLTTAGIMAVSLLRTYLCPQSWEWLNVLLDRYPDHIVEFSSFETYWGNLPHYNTCFWEVRPDRGLGSNLSAFTEVY